MEIKTFKIEDLIEYARNPRKNDAVIDRMVGCIKEFGFRIPIVAKSDGSVVDGHLRLKAAKKLSMTEVPVVIADDLTETQSISFNCKPICKLGGMGRRTSEA
jgi:ParB-like chromosome segregation protein Spo0J